MIFCASIYWYRTYNNNTVHIYIQDTGWFQLLRASDKATVSYYTCVKSDYLK